MVTETENEKRSNTQTKTSGLDVLSSDKTIPTSKIQIIVYHARFYNYGLCSACRIFLIIKTRINNIHLYFSFSRQL